MEEVVREIHIDAAPDVVREHLTDPVRRSGWLDEGPIDLTPTRTGVTYTRGEGDDRARVDIEVLPEADGSRVRVTEQIQQLQLPVGPPVPGARALRAVPAVGDQPEGVTAPGAMHPHEIADAPQSFAPGPPLAQAA